MSEDDRSWHNQHRHRRRSGSEDDVSPIVSILMTICGILVLLVIVVLTVSTMVK